MNSSTIISKVWNFCNTLRDDGVSYGDYLEQLTYLLFLKLADEFSKPPYNRSIHVPKEYNWESLTLLKGADLETHYSKILRELGKQKGILGQVFTKSQNKIQDPAKLSRLIDMIDKEEWSTMGADIKGQIYEGLLEKNAEDTKLPHSTGVFCGFDADNPPDVCDQPQSVHSDCRAPWGGDSKKTTGCGQYH